MAPRSFRFFRLATSASRLFFLAMFIAIVSSSALVAGATATDAPAIACSAFEAEYAPERTFKQDTTNEELRLSFDLNEDYAGSRYGMPFSLRITTRNRDTRQEIVAVEIPYTCAGGSIVECKVEVKSLRGDKFLKLTAMNKDFSPTRIGTHSSPYAIVISGLHDAFFRFPRDQMTLDSSVKSMGGLPLIVPDIWIFNNCR